MPKELCTVCLILNKKNYMQYPASCYLLVVSHVSKKKNYLELLQCSDYYFACPGLFIFQQLFLCQKKYELDPSSFAALKHSNFMHATLHSKSEDQNLQHKSRSLLY